MKCKISEMSEISEISEISDISEISVKAKRGNTPKEQTSEISE